MPAGQESTIATLRQYRYFVTVVELGSMTRAADQLNVAQPALGLQMRQLEQELGVTLLQRHSRGVLPTSAGQLLFERGREILDLVERTGREVAAFGAQAMETVRLGLTNSLMTLLASDLLVRVRGELPQVSLLLVEEMSFVLLDALVRRDVDIALAYDLPDTPGLTRTPWLQEDLVFVTAHHGEYGRPDPQGLVGTVDLAEVLQSEMALAGGRDPLRQIVTMLAATLGMEPKVVFEVQSVQAMKVLVMDGLAAAILPYGSAMPELLTGRMSGRRIVRPGVSRTLCLVTTPKFDDLRGAGALLRLLATSRDRMFSLLGPMVRAV